VFYLWMKILLILLIIAIGLLVVKKNKGTTEAATASTASFVMLFAIAALYLFLVVALQQTDLLFWLVAAAIVFPFLTYAIVFASVKQSQRAAAARTMHKPAMKPVRPVAVGPAARKTAKAPHDKSATAVAAKIKTASPVPQPLTASSESTEPEHVIWSGTQVREAEIRTAGTQSDGVEAPMAAEASKPVAAARPIEHRSAEPSTVENIEMPASRKPMRAYQPVLSGRPAYNGQTLPKKHPAPQSPSVSESEKTEGAVGAMYPASATSGTPKPLQPLFTEPAIRPSAQPQSEQEADGHASVAAGLAAKHTASPETREQQPASDPFAICCAKAQLLRAKGLCSAAGVLYERAADMEADEPDSYDALFNALSCYVKAGKTAEACLVADRLSAHVEHLQPDETAKLSAMLSYLQRHLKQ
jgi:Ca2+/Na+ antiporter